MDDINFIRALMKDAPFEVFRDWLEDYPNTTLYQILKAYLGEAPYTDSLHLKHLIYYLKRTEPTKMVTAKMMDQQVSGDNIAVGWVWRYLSFTGMVERWKFVRYLAYPQTSRKIKRGCQREYYRCPSDLDYQFIKRCQLQMFPEVQEIRTYTTDIALVNRYVSACDWIPEQYWNGPIMKKERVHIARMMPLDWLPRGSGV